MNWDQKLKNLAARAQEEILPVPRVASHVLAQLNNPVQPMLRFSDRPLMWMAGLSSVAAILIVLLALSLYHGVRPDPLNEVFETVSWANIQ